MLGDISESGVVGDATRAKLETGQAILEAVIPRIVQVVSDMSTSERSQPSSRETREASPAAAAP
jgi:creatinine amidohydrolase/Fe(II)-dependent formamide hydrolase-like protein